MHGRKRKGNGISDDDRFTTDAGYAGEVLHDFKRNSPYWQYRAVRYQQYRPFDEYRDEIDRYLEKLFAGEVDEENGDILDNLIGDITRQALHHLDRQRVEHRDTIHSLHIRHESDRILFESQMQHLKEALVENRRNQEIVMALLKKDEFVCTGGKYDEI